MNKLLRAFIIFSCLLPCGGAVFALDNTNKLPGVGIYSFKRLNLSVSPLTAKLDMSEKSDDNFLYVSDQVTVSNIYPNPASEVASFNYIFYDANTNVKVVIRNVLGSVVGEYNLPPQERHLTVPVDKFIPGVYFYTLWVNNKSMATKKLVVKR